MTVPFDAIAQDYDRDFTKTAVGQMQREVVWAALRNILRQPIGARVLELNCGTGEDALWLARHGCRVLATDISSEMVAVTQGKARHAGLDLQIETLVCSIESLTRCPPLMVNRQPSIVFSNFGGLNCVAPKALRDLGKTASALLAPGGHLVVVVMGRFCWWETLYFLLKGKWKEAWRRQSSGPVKARLDDEAWVDTWYYAPREFAHCFPEFTMERLEPVGFWAPPSYLDGSFQRWPRVLRVIGWLERKCRWRGLAGGSDHYLMVLRRSGK